MQELQGGDRRADYGRQVIEDLSKQLTKQYGKGFSTTNLWYFRQFYQAYPNRLSIIHPRSGECLKAEKFHLTGGELPEETKSYPPGTELVTNQEDRQAGDELRTGFSLHLSWSHYRALMRVTEEKTRLFYELEAIECGWNKAQLERQIHSSYYERIISNRGEAGLTASDRERLPGISGFPETMLSWKMRYML